MKIIKLETIPSIMGISREEFKHFPKRQKVQQIVENFNLKPDRREVEMELDALKTSEKDQYFVTAIERLKTYILL